MAVNTVAFALTSAAYQDVSGGFEKCSFRLPFVSNRDNGIRLYLGTSLPDADTNDFDEFRGPEKIEDEWQFHITDMSSTNRVYLRALRMPVRIVAYRI